MSQNTPFQPTSDKAISLEASILTPHLRMTSAPVWSIIHPTTLKGDGIGIFSKYGAKREVYITGTAPSPSFAKI
jgi:hypothetical protein